MPSGLFGALRDKCRVNWHRDCCRQLTLLAAHTSQVLEAISRWYALVMSWQAVKITDRKRATLQRALVLLLLDVLLLDVGLCPRKDHICEGCE